MTVGSLPREAASAVYSCLQRFLRQQYFDRCHEVAPHWLCRVTRLAFLPHTLSLAGRAPSWRHLSFDQIAHGLHLSPVAVARFFTSPVFTRVLQPTDDAQWTAVPQAIAAALLRYRLATGQHTPIAVRALFSYNVSGWSTVGAERDAKMRWLQRSLREGPVLLQETRWTDTQPRDLMQTLPGVQVVSTPALPSSTGLSGGAALILPSGWQIAEQWQVLAGRITAARLSLRGGDTCLVCCYFHPAELSACCAALQRFLLTQEGYVNVVVGGDFNRAWEQAPGAWQDLLDSACLQLHAPATTSRGPHGLSCLDGFLVHDRLVHQQGHRCWSSSCWPHEKFGHAVVRLRISPPAAGEQQPGTPETSGHPYKCPTSTTCFDPGGCPSARTPRHSGHAASHGGTSLNCHA
jgi:hypothetical protein